MYKVVIIDDEINIQNSLKHIINEFADDVQVVGSANDVRTGLQIIKDMQPDIVFLDIQMPDGTGFDLLKQLSNINFSLIFCTAHDCFAIKAFKYNAIDYVLKPFDIEDITIAIERAKQNFSLKQRDVTIRELLEFKKSEKKRENIILKTATDVFIVKINDIYNCESDKGYTTFKFEDDRKIIVSQSLKEYEEIFKNHNFIKTHQSYLVNINYIDSYHKKYGGYLVLKNGREIPVSVRKKGSIIDILENLHS